MLEELNKLNGQNINKDYIQMAKFPNPIFRRKDFILLNGDWDFKFDPHDVGENEKWYKSFPQESLKIKVPYAYQSKESGICESVQQDGSNDFVWYRRFISIKNLSKTYILKFGAVDYLSKVYINGELIGEHSGGFTPFSFEVSQFLHNGENEIIIKVEDYLEREDIARGKQFWEKQPKSIWYTPTTGIWQNVWLETTGSVYIDKFKINPDIDAGNLAFEIFNNNLSGDHDYKLLVEIFFKEEVISKIELKAKSVNKFSIDVLGEKSLSHSLDDPKSRIWSPENPAIFNIKLSLVNQNNSFVSDFVQTYSAMRKIHSESGLVYLNNRPFYQRLVLDQGYWPDSLMTATSLQHLKDIILAKSLGFNGARKHQKIESVHYYFWADMLGFLVWAEMPSSIMFSEAMVKKSFSEWCEVVENYQNHPSIITWVPINESWGISNIFKNEKHLNYSLAIYHLTNSLDPSRLVVNNDGWEVNKTDIVGIHNYAHGNPDQKQVRECFESMFNHKESFLASMPAGRNLILKAYFEENLSKPIILSEFGGISFINNKNSDWGYSSVNSKEMYLNELTDIFTTVIKTPFIQGYCYTQLYDVEQETNGLLTANRECKLEAEKVKTVTMLYKEINKG